MNRKSAVGERIKKIRGLETQTEFALRLGITQRAVVNYETLGRVPKGPILRKICEQYGVEERWLLTGDGTMYQQEEPSAELSPKTCDMSQVLGSETTQHLENIVLEKNQTCDMSQVLELQRDLLEAVRQNGDLRVEVERLRMDIERRDARIAELERRLAEALKPQGRKALLDKGRAAAG